MKFTHGTWFLKDDVKIINANRVRAYDTDDKSISCYAPMRKISHRGETLDGPMLTYRFSTPAKNIIKVQLYHFIGTGDDKKNPEFLPEIPATVVSEEDYLTLKSGELSVKIDLNNSLNYEFLYKGNSLTKSAEKSSGHITQNGNTYMRDQLDIKVDEHVYGLGERFGPFVKNGQCVEMWNEDSGTNSDLAYKNIPFYVTDKGYGVFVNNSGKVSFEVDSERLGRVSFSVNGEYLEYYIIAGEDMKAAVSKYTELTGKPPLVPLWSLGLWLSTSFSTDYNEETVMGFIDGMLKNNIPLSVFHFDCFWMKEMEWCNFEWDTDAFPDPCGMIERIHQKGIKTCVWINPYFAQKSKLFAVGCENGYFIKNANDKVFQRNEWQAGNAILDVTNPQAVQWYKENLRNILKTGVDCFKTDFGERIPTEDVVYHSGADPLIMRNRYAYMYNEIVYNLLVEELGEKEAIVFARGAWAGSQKFPTHWGGDCWSTYQSMKETLRGGLSLSLAGFAYWSHDLGGFEDASTPDVYKRWTAFGLLSSHSRLHGSKSYRVPWHYDDEAVSVLEFFTDLKLKLVPYYYALSHNAKKTGVPLLRPMVLEFGDDRNCSYIDSQFMMGSSLLVAPILNDESKAIYYLPKGKWYNIITGKEYDGGEWIEEIHGYKSLPLMMRENSIIPMCKNGGRPTAKLEGIEFKMYRLKEGNHICEVYDEDGNVGSISVSVMGDKYEIKSQNLTNYSITIVEIGEKLKPNKDGVIVRTLK